MGLQDCVIQEVLPNKQMTAAFFTLYHEGEPKHLVAAEIPSVTQTVELHTMVMDGEVMKMQQIPSYTVQAGENRFVKGGHHLMLMSIETIPSVGSVHQIRLRFDDGEVQMCDAEVLSVDAVIERFRSQLGESTMTHTEHDMAVKQHTHQHG